MPEARPAISAVGRAVASQVEALRVQNRLSFAKLSEALSEIGRPIPPLGLRRIRELERRVDVDDLAALAKVLKTTPAALMDQNASDQYRRDVLRWLLAETEHQVAK